MRIGIDFDDVLVDFMTAFLVHYNRAEGTVFSREDIWSFDLWKVFGIPKDEAARRVYEFLFSSEAGDIPCIPGAKECIATLAREHELFIVTGRQHRIAEATERLVSKHFGSVFRSVHFANHFSQDTPHMSKGILCDTLGLDILIDDSLRNAEESVAVGREIILFDAPWNASYVPIPSIQKVCSWGEVLSVIGSLPPGE